MGEGPNQRGLARPYHGLRWSGNLERLQTDHIDLYQLHGTDTVTPIDETLRALDDLVCQRQGALCRRSKLAGIGASPRRWASADARALPRFETLQAYYSIAGRDLEREMVPLLQRGEAGPDGVVATGGWAAVGQIRAGRAGQWRGPPRHRSISRRSTRIAPGRPSPRCTRCAEERW